MDTVLKISNLTKRFLGKKNRKAAVDNISFSVGKGEIVGLLGPNGAGKTTTISMILGILEPTAGSITVFGLPFNAHRSEILERMNFSSAYTRAPWRLTVAEHLMVFAKIYGVPHAKSRIKKLTDAFHMSQQAKTYCGDLSSGNMARLNLAKAFINYPELVVLDEPTSSLDPDSARIVRSYLKTEQKKYKTSILITSHNMAEIEELADRVIFINSGRIVREGTPEELARTIDTTRVTLYMRDGQKRTLAYCKEHKYPITTDNRFVIIELKESHVSNLLSGLAQKGVDYSEIAIAKPTLEDFFIRAVSQNTFKKSSEKDTAQGVVTQDKSSSYFGKLPKEAHNEE